MDNREANRAGHPSACTCVECKRRNRTRERMLRGERSLAAERVVQSLGNRPKPRSRWLPLRLPLMRTLILGLFVAIGASTWAGFLSFDFEERSIHLGESSVRWGGAYDGLSEYIDEQRFHMTHERLTPFCTGSMRPIIRCGDDILVRRSFFRPTDIEVGDIIVYSRPPDAGCIVDHPAGAGLIVHRAIEKHALTDETTYRAKGDANATPDGCVIRYSDVYGVVVARDREGKITRF